MGKRKKKPPVREGEFITSKDGSVTTYLDKQFERRDGPKRERILVGSLTLTSVNFAPYGSHLSNFYQMGRDCKDYDFTLITPRRMAIDRMRNFCVEVAIKGEFKYIYFFDDDTVGDFNVVGRLLPRMEEFNAICGSYYIRGYPFDPMVFTWIDKSAYTMKLYGKKAESLLDEDGVLRKDVAGIGCGCTLFRTEDFTKVPYPWFKTGGTHTEDAWWFTLAHKYILDYKVGMDFNVSCGHLCDPIFVDSNNVHVLRRFHKQLHKYGGVFQ